MTRSPEQFRIIASDLRQLATEKQSPIAHRARLVILAEQFDELADEAEKRPKWCPDPLVVV